MPPKIQNVISTADLHQHIDARKLNQYQWGKYDTEVYGGRCGYIKDKGMQGRVSVFLSGKMISTGAKSVSQSTWQLEHVMHLLYKNKLAKQVNLAYKVQNIVATLDLHKRLDVKRVIGSLSNYIYEPDNFPGVIYKPSGSGVSCLMFASGKVVPACTCLSTPNQNGQSRCSILRLINNHIVESHCRESHCIFNRRRNQCT